MSDQSIRCRQIKKKYQAYLDEELEKEMLRKIKQHFEQCPDCKIRIRFEAKFHTVIRKRSRKKMNDRSVPDRLRERILSKLF